MRTEGDVRTDIALSQVAGSAFFTRTIEEALSRGEIDVAVHSLKDLATASPDGLVLGALLPRADPRDVLVTRSGAGLAALPPLARVGTSSLRRRALLRRWRSDLALVEQRGNVPTRLRRLDEGDLDAVVLAAAGLERLALVTRVAEYLPVERVLPAPGQGAIAVQVRRDDPRAALVRALDHAPTRAATSAERAFLRAVEAGCQAPVGALAEAIGGELRLQAIVLALDGGVAVEGTRSGPATAPEALGERLAEDLLRRGADALLAAIRARVVAPPP